MIYSDEEITAQSADIQTQFREPYTIKYWQRDSGNWVRGQLFYWANNRNAHDEVLKRFVSDHPTWYALSVTYC